MASKSFCFFLLVLCSWVIVGFSQGGGGGGGGNNLPCLTKLLPCQQFLKSSSTPPPTCCLPLKSAIADDSKCLCAVFSNPEIMKGLNATQEDALNLAKNCGANADTSLCKKAGAPTPTVSPFTPSDNSSSSTNSTAHEPAKAKAAAILIGNSVSVTSILSLIASTVF